jgi:type VI protein secretion system component VasA
MARRESIISTSSLPVPNSHVESLKSPTYIDPLPSTAISVSRPLRTSSLSTYSFPKSNNVTLHMDPDELFTQRTVGEVKSVQIQLRRVMMLVLLANFFVMNA